jgi:hypothetical protein
MTCEQARNYLKQGGERTNVVVASRRIVACGDLAPTTLIAALRIAPPGSARDSVTQEAAWYLSDRRLLDSTIALSRDLHVTGERRGVALALLTHYADSLAYLVPGGLADSSGMVIATLQHGSYVASSYSLTATDQSRALDAIAWIAANEREAGIKALAQAAYSILLRRRSL